MIVSNIAVEVRRAARALLRAPLLAAVAVLSIGLSVGAVTCVFSWLDSLVLHPFPRVRDPSTVAGLEVAGPTGGGWPVSYPTIQQWKQGASFFHDVAAWGIVRVSERDQGEQESRPLIAMDVSGSYFGLLGSGAAFGRVISPEDDASIAPVAVLGHTYWMRQYGGDRGVLGKTIIANGFALRVVGVAQPKFSGTYVGVVPDLFVPISLYPSLTGSDPLHDRTARLFQSLARLNTGVDLAHARREFDALARRLSAEAGDRPVTGAIVKDIRTQYLGGLVLPLFAAMLAVSGLLLFVACANVASLTLVRVTARSQELAIRLALGASAGRVAVTALTESAIIAAAGGCLGVLAASASRGLLYRMIPTESLPLSLPIAINARVVALAIAASAVVALLAAAAPTIRTWRTPPVVVLRAGGRSLATGASRLRNAIVALQIALSLACLVQAAVFVDGLRVATRVPLGLSDPEQVLVVTTNLAAAHLNDTAATNAIETIIDGVSALPGVRVASAATYVPLSVGGRPISDLKVEGFSPEPNQDMTAIRVQTGPGLVALLGTRLVVGSDFDKRDRRGTLPVAVVNETFARRFYPRTTAIGHRIDAGHGWATIVGVIADGKYGSITESPQAVAYFPILQWSQAAFNVFVRTSGPPLALIEPVRRVLRATNVDFPALQPRTLSDHIAGATFVQRTGASVLSSFGLAALGLAIMGLYGALAIAVSQRRRELGIRLTLGAPRGAIAWLVLRHGMRIAAAGLLIGVPLAIALSRLLRGAFDNAGTFNPLALAALSAAMVLAAAVAALVPARRAISVDPIEVLRGD